jgi:hypothetical protein
MALATDARAYVAGNHLLQLDGVNVGFLRSVEGGDAYGEVVTESAGGTYFQKKHIGSVRYSDVEMELGWSLTKPIYEWIAASWEMNYARKDGKLVALDYNMTATSEREFFNALITETTIPACDAASKEPAYLTVRFQPEYTRSKKPSTRRFAATAFGKDARMWLPSNFRLEIPGLDCSKVSRVDSFTVKQPVQQEAIGDGRDYALEPGRIVFPDLKITLPERSVESWAAWHQDFVVNGRNDEGHEKGGRLVFLSADRKQELADVTFFNLGIYSLKKESDQAGADAIRRYTAALYCEKMELNYLAPVIA